MDLQTSQATVADKMLRTFGMATIWADQKTDCSYMLAILSAPVEYAWHFAKAGWTAYRNT